MAIQSLQTLQSLSFNTLAQSKRLTLSDQQSIATLLAIGEHAPLNNLIEIQAHYPEKLGAIINNALSNPSYVEDCLKLTKIECLFETVQRFSRLTPLRNDIQNNLSRLKVAVIDHFEQIPDIDLVVIAMDQNHDYNRSAKKALTAKLNHQLLDNGIAAYVQNGMHSFLDDQLKMFAINPEHPLNDVAKSVLTTKLNNHTFNTFGPSITLTHAEELISVLGQPAMDFIRHNFSNYTDMQLKFIATNPQHFLYEDALAALKIKLINGTFHTFSTILDVESLISVVDTPAITFLKNRLPTFSGRQLMRIVLNEDHPLNGNAQAIVINQLEQGTFRTPNTHYDALILVSVIGQPARQFIQDYTSLSMSSN